MAEFKRAKSEFTSQIETEVRRLEEEENNKILRAENINTQQAPAQPPTGTVTSTGEITPEQPTVNGTASSQETHA